MPTPDVLLEQVQAGSHIVIQQWSIGAIAGPTWATYPYGIDVACVDVSTAGCAGILQSNARAQHYKVALEMAKKNLKTLQAAGVPIAFGTDSGPPARFQGYFEHMEVDLMADAGLTPMEILISATSGAARSLKLKGVGALEKGNWADFVVLTRNPLENIKNIHGIESVWIAGNRVPGR